MRNPWRLITARGKLLALIGAITVLAAMLFGQRDLLWVGLFLIFLPLIAWLIIGRSRLRLAAQRELYPSEVAIGDPMTGEIAVSKRSRLPQGVLLFADHVPSELGRSPQFLISDLDPHWQHDVTYPLTARSRGRFRTGPLLVRSTDPLGMVTHDRQFTATTEVMVMPRIHPLGPMRVSGSGSNTGESRPQTVGTLGPDDVMIREYRAGDDVRRIHWPSTARRGDVMVRREEQAWDPSATIILDSRSEAHVGAGPDASLEWAVSAAASIAQYFLDQRYAVDLYHADGAVTRAESPDGHQLSSRQVLMHALTDLRASRQPTMSKALEAELAGQSGELLVAICGLLTPADAEVLLRARRTRSQAMALVADVPGWVLGPDDEPIAVNETQRNAHRDAVRILRDHQWRVVEVPRDKALPLAWRELDLMGALI
ncbi:DUF58 domain-containing protein [Naumannella cuiyingiana]|uniref:Uncharacterized protein (DUF58 family) n=1 Tax=Naumannella cuiyingiana TaxID=1347891 RepID=A0A7Z0DB76_9ACTN|nr:DUF58 domain-containing protein [Naumannella cuiyingiana]NYI72088.1 uncharacterized protein (DUF58 family) [Naumannella cuiyingiana]